MVYLALVNVGLIAFDLTYLSLRPVYHQHLPQVTRLYDQLKGIRPSAAAERFEELLDGLGEGAAGGADSQATARRLAELRDLSWRMATAPAAFGGPARDAATDRARRRFAAIVRHEIALRDGRALSDLDLATALDELWKPTRWSGSSEPSIRRFVQQELRPLIAGVYDREVDRRGRPTDHFWWIDLPFLILFAGELLVRWILAIRRRELPRWWMFPVVHWYDVLGILPVRELRFFRLFRVASIYVRLYRSDRTPIGEDLVSRAVKFLGSALLEEISDRVAVRLLSEAQDEFRGGTHREILRAIAVPYRDAVAGQITARLRQVLVSPDAQEHVRAYFNANLSRVVDSAEALRRLPLPTRWTGPLVELAGTVIFDTLLQTAIATLEVEDGRRSLEDLVAAMIDGITQELTSGEIEELIREICLESIEELKKAISVRKWMASQREDKPD